MCVGLDSAGSMEAGCSLHRQRPYSAGAGWDGGGWYVRMVAAGWMGYGLDRRMGANEHAVEHKICIAYCDGLFHMAIRD